MTDQWVRSPEQQALAEAQAIVDAQARPDIVVRHYPGVPEAAVADFKTDAAQMIPTGWYPVSVVYAAIVLDPATVLALGTVAIAAKVPGGSLVVTYRYQLPDAVSSSG